jgi:hypothetical protein
MDYRSLTEAAEQRYGLPPGLLYAQMMQESRGNPQAMSPKGAVGLMQFMPATARAMKINPLDPQQAVDGAGRMMRRLIDKWDGSIEHALASYNWGEGRVSKHGLEKMPPETRNYITAITGAMATTSNVPKVATGAADANADLSFLRTLKGQGANAPAAAGATSGEVNDDVSFLRSLGNAARSGAKGAVTGFGAMKTGFEHEVGALSRGLQGGGLVNNPELDRAEQESRARLAQAREDAPFSTAIGQGAAFAPMLAAGGLPAWARLMLYAAPGAMQHGGAAERAGRGAVDAAFGAGGELVGKVFGSLARPGPARTNPVTASGIDLTEKINERAAANAGTKEGTQVALAPWQMGGRGPKSAAAQFQDVLDSYPTSAPAGIARKEGNSAAFNHASGFELGVPLEGSKITESVFAAARKRAHELFDNAVPSAMKFDVTPLDAAAKTSLAKTRAMPQVEAEVAQFEEQLFRHPVMSGNALVRGANGEEMKSLHRWLTDYRSAAYKKGLHSAAEAADDMVEALEQTLHRQIAARVTQNGALAAPSTQVAENFAKARRHYAALSVLERPNVVMHGDVQVGNLAQAIKQRAPSAWAEGRMPGGLNDIAKWHDKLGGTPPNSGTQPRTLAQQLITNPVGTLAGGTAAGGVGGGAVGAMLGDPVAGAGIGMATSLGLPWVVQRAMNSGPMRALYNRPGLPPPIGESTYQLLRSTGLLGGLGMAPQTVGGQ